MAFLRAPPLGQNVRLHTQDISRSNGQIAMKLGEHIYAPLGMKPNHLSDPPNLSTTATLRPKYQLCAQQIL